MQALAARAVDAARAAGASYADARLTILRQQRFDATRITTDSETFGVGVRVLVNGFWGFQSSAVRTPDEMVRLARGAVGQAKASSRGTTREIRWDPIPVVKNESWIMPVKYDPFDIPVGERADFAGDVSSYMNGLMDANPMATYVSMQFRREYKVFASSEGSSWTQTTYGTKGDFSLGYRDQYSQGLFNGWASANTATWAGKGWEYLSESGIIDQIPAMHDEAEQRRHTVPVEVNRYDMVFSAQAMASVLDPTIGAATELDRALGYEANASGTSYIRDPLAMLGTFQVGTPLLNVVAERSTPGAVGTTKWDDESVTPESFQIVKDGTLIDVQTTREQAGWIAAYYDKAGLPIRSHGCANAESGSRMSMQMPPNLQLLPGKSDTTTFDSLVAETKNGVAVISVDYAQVDHQQNGCMCRSQLRKITNGKLGPFITYAAVYFRAPQFWKNLLALGGPSSAQWYGFQTFKGDPQQTTFHSVRAVPAKIKDLSLVDLGRGGW